MKNILVIIVITATLAASAQVPNYVPTNGLVGWWGFNGNANDESGNGNNGTVIGTALTADRFGNPNSAYDFDGVDDLITSSIMSTIQGQNQMTWSCWFVCRSNPVDGQPNRIISKDNLPGVNENRMALIINNYAAANNTLHFVFHDAINTSNVHTNYPIVYDSLYHAVLVVNTTELSDSNKLKLFVNGILTDYTVNGTVLPLTPSNQYNMRFGGSLSTNNYWDGTVDDIGIWNRALTQCEIQDLYNAQLNSVDVSAGNDLTVCEGDEIVLSGSGADSYSWNNGVLDSIPFVATNTSEYVVVGTDTLCCLGTDTMQVNVLSTSSSSQNETSLDSYVWSVNGQTYTQSGTYTDTLLNVLGCDSIVTLNLDLNFTGIESENNNEFNVFPNPVNELLTIVNSSNASKKITLIDKQGRLVLESIISKETNTINLAHLESGNYLLFIEGNDYPIQIIKK